MVSIVSALVAVTVVIAGVAQGLPVGEYFRPPVGEVSGRIGATTPYLRSPCPAINTLANHGYLPRDGKNVTHAQLRTALQDVYNIGTDLIGVFLGRLPDGFPLSDMSQHNFIEHDASLVHADTSTDRDPAALDKELWLHLINHATNDQLGVQALAAVRRERLTQCHAKPSGCEFGVKQRVLAFGEAALLLRCLGGANTETMSVAFAKSFLMDEQLPATYTKPSTPVSVTGVLVTAGNIQLFAWFQDIVGWFYR